MHIRRWIYLGALTPPLATMARLIARTALLMLVVLASSSIAAHLVGVRDRHLLRAACASKTASAAARSLVSMASIPRRSEAVATMVAAWDAEAQAWGEAPVECE